MSIGIAYNPCKSCKEMDKCSFCELTYYRRGCIKSPTADVVDVRHAYWKIVTELKDDTVYGNKVNIQYKICSGCEYPMGVTDNIYCGHCGAKMDGERSEDNEG